MNKDGFNKESENLIVYPSNEYKDEFSNPDKPHKTNKTNQKNKDSKDKIIKTAIALVFGTGTIVGTSLISSNEPKCKLEINDVTSDSVLFSFSSQDNTYKVKLYNYYTEIVENLSYSEEKDENGFYNGEFVFFNLIQNTEYKISLIGKSILGNNAKTTVSFKTLKGSNPYGSFIIDDSKVSLGENIKIKINSLNPEFYNSQLFLWASDENEERHYIDSFIGYYSSSISVYEFDVAEYVNNKSGYYHIGSYDQLYGFTSFYKKYFSYGEISDIYGHIEIDDSNVSNGLLLLVKFVN